MRATSIRMAAAALLVAASGGARAQGLVHAGTILADSAGLALKAPEGIACGAAGTLVVADTGNGRLLTVSTGADAVVAKELRIAQVAHPTRVRLGRDGATFVLDRKTRRVARVVDGKFVGWVEVPGEATGSVAAGAFALDPAGNLYLLDLAKNVVQVIDAAGTSARKITLPSADDALIVDISADEAGTLFAVDALGRRIWSAPAGASALKPFSKSLKDVMSFPAYVAPFKGRLYVVDQNGAGLVVLGQDGGFLGRRLSLGWNEGLVRYPAQICFDESGQLFVADRQNNRVQSFSVQ